MEGIRSDMNETIALIMACIAPLGAWFISSFFKKRKTLALIVFLILSTPALWISLNYPLILLTVLGLTITLFLIVDQQELIKSNTLKEEEEKKEILSSFNKEKDVFDRIAATEREFASLYMVIKILSETFDFKNVSSLVKDKISGYLGSKSVSMFLIDGQEIEKFFGEVDISQIINKAAMFEREDFIFLGQEALYAFRENGFILFFFHISGFDLNKEILKEKLENLSLEIFPAIKRISLFKKIDKLSVVDGLTGVYRRGVFDEKLAEEISRSKTFKTRLALMILDIDHFKRINDTYGHQAGDQVLKKIAKVLKDSVYETDFIARYGGEEFAVIMPRAQKEGTLRKAEHIRKLIENEVFDVGVEKIRITISAGIAHYPDNATTLKDLISNADSALYKAKESGRNRICQY